MKDVWNSFLKHWSTRMKTGVYGIFGFWWVVLHWEFFYTVVFVDQQAILDKTGKLKNEYLHQRFADFQYLDFWLYNALSILTAGLLTYLMIWIIPRFILLPAYRQEQKHEADKRRAKLQYEQGVQVAETRLEEQETKRLAAATKRATQQKKARTADPTIAWQQEYDEFTTSPLYEDFEELIRSLYDYKGRVSVLGDFKLDRKVLAYADANNLVQYDRKENIISLTDKGKFFVKQYQSDRG